MRALVLLPRKENSEYYVPAIKVLWKEFPLKLSESVKKFEIGIVILFPNLPICCRQ
jgi:hypothetical protein